MSSGVKDGDAEEDFWDDCVSSDEEIDVRPTKRVRAIGSFVRSGQRVHPASAYWGTPAHSRALNARREEDVIRDFLAEEMVEGGSDGEGYFTSYVLDDFVMYRKPDIKPVAQEAMEGEKTSDKAIERGVKGQGEYELPSSVYTTVGLKNLLFDGVLKSGNKEEALYGVSFEMLSLGNLVTPSEHNLDHQIWIQSHVGAKAAVDGGVWYELGKPAKEYKQHWEAFQWVALLVKYVSDALEICLERQQKVTLSYFHKDFALEMRRLHGKDPVFQRWMTAFGKNDFRSPMAAHAEFLWQELSTAHSEQRPLTKHLRQPLWGEILPTDLTAIRPAHIPQCARPRCVVTSYVGNLFEWIFGEGVEVIEPDSDPYYLKDDGIVSDSDLDLVAFGIPLEPEVKNGLPPKYYDFHHDEYGSAIHMRFTTSAKGMVKVGDVVEIGRDDATRWKKSTQKWYAYVRELYTTPKGDTRLHILWLYWPEDTALCMSMKYPHSNELFFSDHCECGKIIRIDEVVRKVAVEFYCIDGKPKDPDAEFFIRQKYHSTADDIHFASLTPEDVSPEAPCPCRANSLPTFTVGDFVLVREKKRLQPYRFEGYEGSGVKVRVLHRRVEVENSSTTPLDRPAKVNELVWTDEIVKVSKRSAVRKCHVVEVKGGEEVPSIVDWASGSSDWFFYRSPTGAKGDSASEAERMDIETLDQIAPIAVCKPVIKRPQEPGVQRTSADINNSTESVRELYDIPDDKRLRGLDLFCGGGNFGRGVAAGGAVRHKWAVDIDSCALHTYRANLEHTDVNLYLGSINNFLFDVITDRRRHLPGRGEIDIIVAGSPCQGFSNANPQGHEALKSLSNSALVCTTLSAIDFYRPKYAILENVPAMASDRKYRGQQVNVSNQIMCALIGMGYQCRCLLLDAWTFGAPQSRTRLFIEIAAPGCALPEIPHASHAHPPSIRGRSVGKTAADVKFAERDLDIITSFPPVKLRDFWDDLPDIGNGHLGVCIPFPDHRTYWIPNARNRGMYACIPHADSLCSNSDARYPGYQYALKRNLIPDYLKRRELPPIPSDVSFSRFNPDALVPTVTCIMTPQSRVSGRTLHYSQDRPMSNMEAKRAQGFLDTDVLIGKPSKTFRVIGNSVCRQVAFALGVKLAEAVRKGPIGGGIGVPVMEEVSVERSRKDTRVGSQVTTPSKKFMVLIDKKPRISLGSNYSFSQANGKNSKDLRVEYSVRDGVEKWEVSLPSTPRKRIRIEVEDDE